MSCSDAAAPIELTLTNDPDALDSSAPNVATLSIGNPPQQLRFTPATTFINSAVHITPRCGNSTNPRCSGDSYGGIYDSTKSQTYSAAAFNTWNGSHDAGQTTLTSTYFNDILRFTDVNTLTSFPMVTLDTMLDIPNVLGIGTNSTVIAQAHSAGLIASSSWSLYAGTKSAPGSLILGGYSERFVSGDLVAGTSDPTCTVCVQVTGMTLDTAMGSLPVMRAGQGTFLAQFEPFINFLSLPSGVFDAWLKVTNGSVGQQDFASYKTGSIPTGNLTITLSSGINITIPNADLFTSNMIIGNGSAFTPVSGNQVAKVRRAPNLTGAFGLPFMSQVYMVYDMDRQMVNYSKAVPNPKSNGQLTRICSASSGQSSPNSNSTTTSNASGNSNTGAIAGGVVGGLIALLIAIVAIVFLILRHKRQQGRNRPNSDASDMPLEKDSHTAYPLSVISKSSQDHSSYRQVTQSPVEAYVRPQVEVQGDTPAYELPSSNMKSHADLSYDRYELPASPPSGGSTMASGADSTLANPQGTAHPATDSTFKISPSWGYH